MQYKLLKCLAFQKLLIFQFRVETIDGSANEGEDYEPLDEILTFEPNETEKEVSYFRYLSLSARNKCTNGSNRCQQLRNESAEL